MARTQARPKWIWPLVLLIMSLIVFWVLPYQLPDQPVQIEYRTTK